MNAKRNGETETTTAAVQYVRRVSSGIHVAREMVLRCYAQNMLCALSCES